MTSEGRAALEHRQHRLQRDRPLRPVVAKKPGPRRGPLPPGDPAGLSFYFARRRIRPDRDPVLLALAKLAFERVPKQVLRELLEAASVRHATERHLDGAIELVSSDRFVSLPREEQLELIELYRSAACSDEIRSALLALIDADWLHRRPREERRSLLRYVVGPRVGSASHPEHQHRLQAFWGARAAEARRFTEIAPLFEPVRPFHVLRTLADLNLVILVFGSPSDRKSLSFGRFYTRKASGHRAAVVVSPDPRIASGWSGDDPLTHQSYEQRSVMLTRIEELELLRWVETNHAIGSDASYHPMWIPFSMFANARSLGRVIEPITNLLASIRAPLTFERTMIERGRPQAEHKRERRELFRQLEL